MDAADAMHNAMYTRREQRIIADGWLADHGRPAGKGTLPSTKERTEWKAIEQNIRVH